MQNKKYKKMNRVTISIPKEIDLNFRQKAAIKFSFERGWYGKAIMEAIEFWITHHSDKEPDIPSETRKYLWNSVKDKIQIETVDEPQGIVESIVDYFKNLKFSTDIKYEINDQRVIIRKEDPIETYAPFMVTRVEDSIFLNCPVKAVISAALKDLTGQDLQIQSNESSLLYVYNGTKYLNRESLPETPFAAHSSQFL